MIIPSAADRGVVVFKIYRSMPYGPRLLAALGLAAAGIAAQALTGSLVLGAVLLAAASLLLVVRGYDNRVDRGSYAHAAEWSRVDRKVLSEVIDLQRRMQKWDTSALDITNPLGFFMLLLFAGGIVLLFVTEDPVARFVAVDAGVLLLPHWVTGVRQILTFPKVVVRANALSQVLDATKAVAADLNVQVLALLSGGEAKLPRDFKVRVMPKEPPEGFLGLYGQIVVNDVNGTSYPYLYCVLTARRGYGLKHLGDAVDAANLSVEWKEDGDVEVLVLRQVTTKKSGYHTDSRRAAEILRHGIAAMRLAVDAKAAKG